ncbi:ecdysone oxidase-like [Ostrinia nubilalis]|uniref:ecdysone oxidase-like n=1 Tax=Ostrinia nubilalis TaxID=29057 RepID=UPI0030824627
MSTCGYNATCLAPTTGTVPQTFASAIQFFAAAQCLLAETPLPDDVVEDGSSFDFIIVGGGSAGCVLANRLSEVEQWKVLLIEAGPSPPVESAIPAMTGGILHTSYDWQYFTQDNGVTNKATVNHTVYWPRAKMLGGCSNINGMVYFRGNNLDYQRWYDAGNTDWSPDVVKECFKKAENVQDQSLLENPDLESFYGTQGPLIINTFNSTYRDLTLKVLQSWDEIGIETVEDLNFNNNFGSGIFRATAANGRRSSTEYVYLRPARTRDNLYVLTNAMVTKVLINETTLEAEGVEVDVNGTQFSFYATTEVIVSAGTVNTPQLLMLSGIGPKEHLESKNISCLVDLPAVGKYLQDHFIVPVTIYGSGSPDPTLREKSLDTLLYIYNKTGTLAQNTFADVMAFYARNGTEYPEFQNHLKLFNENSSTLEAYLTRYAYYKDVMTESVLNFNKNNTLYLFSFNLLHPQSTGEIILNSSDPQDHPLIYTNYLNNTEDINATVAGIQMLTKIVDTEYFKSINGFLGRMSWPECDPYELDSFEYWQCIAINAVTTIYHPIGTARMGNDTTTSVISSQLKVHCVDKLRVVDASAMMSQISGNINGAVIMVAERAANLIKEDYGFQTNDTCNN